MLTNEDLIEIITVSVSNTAIENKFSGIRKIVEGKHKEPVLPAKKTQKKVRK